MKSLSISFTLGKGYAPHGSNIQHNNRKFIAANGDATRISSNIIYKQQYIEDAYNQLFGKALREYNAEQKKECRKIDDYYAHIVRGHREEPFYEAIVQFGDCHTAPSGTPDGDRVKEMLDEYMKSFQQRNPNLYVFGFNVSNQVFADNSWYFRNALVRANYNDLQNDIHATTVFLEQFMENLLTGARHSGARTALYRSMIIPRSGKIALERKPA